jgi:hypothetical protein
MNRSSVRFRQAAPTKAQVRGPFPDFESAYFVAAVPLMSHAMSHAHCSLGHSACSIRSAASWVNDVSTCV